MKKEQVISIGEQSGFDKVVAQDGGFELFWDQEHLTKELMNFAKLVEQATLERAANKADSVGHHWSGAPARAFFELADAIRALKDSND